LGIVRFARAVDGAAHDRKVKRFLDVGEPAFDLGDDLDEIIDIERPQVGQATTVTPRFLSSSDFRISQPTRTSSCGSAASETRIVSPMPS
jgi:hypothetical protein